MTQKLANEKMMADPPHTCPVLPIVVTYTYTYFSILFTHTRRRRVIPYVGLCSKLNRFFDNETSREARLSGRKMLCLCVALMLGYTILLSTCSWVQTKSASCPWLSPKKDSTRSSTRCLGIQVKDFCASSSEQDVGACHRHSWYSILSRNVASSTWLLTHARSRSLASSRGGRDMQGILTSLLSS